MNYCLNPSTLGEIFAVPAAVVDEHIKLAGSAQLKVLLWVLRSGKGYFDADDCSQSIGLSPADCSDALQYWLATGMLLQPSDGSIKQEHCKNADDNAENTKNESNSISNKKETAKAAMTNPGNIPLEKIPRPRPVKPQMKEVIARQKESEEFAYLLDTASSRLGRPISHGDMETLLYLYDTAGLPVEVILMVIGYAVGEDKYHMRYIEKVALDWADRGINTISAAEQYLCALEHRRQAWHKVSTLLGITQSPTIAQSDAAEKWIYDWKINDGLIRLAYEQCMKNTGKFNSSYVSKILERWQADGVDSVEKALMEKGGGKRKGKNKQKKETSFDLDEYENMVSQFTPVYKK